MNILIESSTPFHCEGVHSVAWANSFAEVKKSTAISTGFLMYPLSLRDARAPNYLERIIQSDSFLVAILGDRVVGFVMAYTLDCLANLTQRNVNEDQLLDFFVEKSGIRGSAIYIAQIAIHPEFKGKSIGTDLLLQLVASGERCGTPTFIAEVAQKPIWNEASSRLFMSCGFKPVGVRVKDADTEPRYSATFFRTTMCPIESCEPILS